MHGYSDVVETARQYYNSGDADNFYSHVWGGEDIHIGIYDSDDEPIADASRRTVERMAQLLPASQAHRRIVDLGSGYGGSARYLARHFGCHVTALNLSETENARNRELNVRQGLQDNIAVIDGSFEEIPADAHTFDVVWSQDAILHSGNRALVIAETARVLKPGGDLLFTDPMQADDCPEGVLQPVLDRIHLDSLGSFAYYNRVTSHAGLQPVQTIDLTPHLVTHYRRVREELAAQRAMLKGRVSEDYMERMDKGLEHWIDAGAQGYLAWGILHFRKSS